MTEYNGIRRRVIKRTNGKERVLKMVGLDHPDFGRLPDGCVDIYELDPTIIRSIDLYSGNDSSTDLRQERQQTVADDFRKSLAFRAKTMLQVRYLAALATKRAEQLGINLAELSEDDEVSDGDMEEPEGSG